jgi:hypothetical protein
LIQIGSMPKKSQRSKLLSTVAIIAAIALTGLVVYPVSRDVQQSWGKIEAKDKPQVGINLLQSIATMAGGLAIFWNIVLTRRQLAATEQQHITDRFSKAVEQLGHQEKAVQIGGIYALERISEDSLRDYWAIMEVLSAFVRDRRALPTDVFLSPDPVSFDRAIQCTIIVLGRREAENDPAKKAIYLGYSDLRRVAFFDLDFRNTRFACSDLRGANFTRSNLQKAHFTRACLSEANFNHSDLTDSILVKADLQEADLTNAILKGADLKGAKLQNVKGLTVEQVKSAQNWREATYDLQFLMLLGLLD